MSNVICNQSITGTLTVSGVLSLPDGSVSAPAIGNTGDTNTGMYWPGDHQVGFAVNGSRKLYISETQAFFQNLSSGISIDSGTGNVLLSMASTDDTAKFTLADNDTTVYFGAKDSIFNFGLNSSVTSNENMELLLSGSKQYLGFGGAPSTTDRFKLKHDVSTDDDVNYTNFKSDFNVSGSTAVSADRTYRAIYADLDSSSTSGDTSDEVRLYGLEANVVDTGDADLLYGVYSYAKNGRTTAYDTVSNVSGGRFQTIAGHTAGAVNNAKGVHGSAQADNAGGTISNLYGGHFEATQSADSDKVISNVYGVFGKVDTTTGGGGGMFTYADGGRFEVEMEVDSATMNTARAVHGILDINDGTVTSGYQFYGSSAVAGGATVTNHWGIYSTGASKNYLEGTLYISEDGSNSATLAESSSGDFTIAAVDDIRLDSGGNDIVLRGASSAEFGRLSNSSQDFVIKNITEDKDIKFLGNDGNGTSGTNITAFRLDMSDAGWAHFNSGITVAGTGTSTFAGDVTISGTINVNRLAGGTPYDNFKITTADIVTTLERVENTGDAAAGYGRLDFKTNAATGGTAGRGGFKFIDGDGDDILYLENNDSSATFAGNVTIAKSTPVLTFNNLAGGGLDPSLTATGTDFTISTTSITPLTIALDTGNATFLGDIIIPDEKQIELGDASGGDLRIYHSSTGSDMSSILNVTGDLEIKSTATDKDIAFRADDGNGGFTTYFWLDGGEATHDGSVTTATYTIWADKSHITLGAGKDLDLYHDGSNSYIYNNTGDLFIDQSADDADIIFKGTDGGADITALTLDMSDAGYATFNSGITATNTSFSGTMNIAGDIYHIGEDPTNTYFGFGGGDDTFRIVTAGTSALSIDSSQDITCTGDLQADGLYIGATNTSYDFYNNGTSYLNGTTTIDATTQINGNVTVGVDDTGYDVKFHGATAGKYMLWDESADRLEIVGDMSITSDGSNDVVLSESGTGNFTIDAPGDINLDADGEQINFKHAGSTIVTLNVDSTPELDVTGNFTIDGSGDITVMANDELMLGAGGDTQYMELMHAVTGGDVVYFNIKAGFPDSVGCHFGTGASSDGDASILHDGSNWYFDTNVGDIIFDAAGDQIRFKDGGSERIVFNLDSTPEMDVTGSFKIDCSGDITLDAAGDQIYMQDSGTTAFTFNCDSTPQLDVSRGDFTIDIVNSDCDFILKGEDGMSAITALTVDMSEAGKATFNNDVVAFSDRKLKKDIKTLDGSKVYDMRGVSFTRIDTNNPGAGVIAQEMQEVAPELVTETNDTLGVSYGNLTGYLIEAIKDLKAEVEELKKQVKDGNSR